MILLSKFEVSDVGFSADYDLTAHRWDLEPNGMRLSIPLFWESGDFAWSVYERTSAVVATGNHQKNQLC